MRVCRKLFIICLLLPLVSAARLSEVMYNPASFQGDDSDLEWIELIIEPEELNIPMKVVAGSSSFLVRPTSRYHIVAREYEDGNDKDNVSFSSFYPEVKGEDASFTLSNNGATLIVENQTYTYDDSDGGDGDGRSLVWNGTTFLPSKTVGGTPGRENDWDASEIQITFLDSIYYLAPYDRFFTLQNKGDPQNVSFRYWIVGEDLKKNETLNFFINRRKTAGTGSFHFAKAGLYELCGQTDGEVVCQNITVVDQSAVACNASLAIDLNESVFDEAQKIEYRFKVSDRRFPFSINYSIDDIFDDSIRKERSTTSLSKKSFTPKFKGKEKSYVLSAELFPTCNDTSVDDNSISQVIAVRGEDRRNDLEIVDLFYNNQSCIVKTKVRAVKADTKKVVEISVREKKVIGQAKTSIQDEGEHELTFVVPLQYCPTTSFTVTARGLGLKESQDINVSVKMKKSKASFSIIEAPPIVVAYSPFSIRVRGENPTNKFYTLRVVSRFARSEEEMTLDIHLAEQSSIEFDLPFIIPGKDVEVMIDIYLDQRKTPIKLRRSIPVFLQKEEVKTKPPKRVVLPERSTLPSTLLVAGSSLLSVFALFTRLWKGI